MQVVKVLSHLSGGEESHFPYPQTGGESDLPYLQTGGENSFHNDSNITILTSEAQVKSCRLWVLATGLTEQLRRAESLLSMEVGFRFADYG